MRDTVLFDLDGTLLQVTQDAFIGTYIAEIRKVFTRLGLDADLAVKALWAGTLAMVLNDGSTFNIQRFWQTFTEYLELSEDRLSTVEAECDRFYTHEFNVVEQVTTPNSIAKRLVHSLKAKGYTVVLATNPLFPACAVETRLNWIGLKPQDFALVTHYANSTYCKPSLGYYQEIFTKIGKTPQQCLMVGNNPVEDMSVAELGTETFLVTDCLESEGEVDITTFRHGSFTELEEYLDSLPDL
ncbi:MAG: HAD family hydrolase [Coriobacteriia bacterium]|nr:HAD family hydrolase [Coriobacteriia bacterium]